MNVYVVNLEFTYVDRLGGENESTKEYVTQAYCLNHALGQAIEYFQAHIEVENHWLSGYSVEKLNE